MIDYVFTLGCLLICDYGHDQARSSSVVNRDTFRAYRNHSQCDPLAEPGMADLTADVDFAAIRARLKARANVFGTVTQRHFLTQLGIGLRLKVFACRKMALLTTNPPLRF